jgi:hypothetical protein
MELVLNLGTTTRISQALIVTCWGLCMHSAMFTRPGLLSSIDLGSRVPTIHAISAELTQREYQYPCLY